MTSLHHQISIKINQQCLTCILEPSLVLSHYGLALAQSLGNFAELWIVREFCQIIDNINFYQQHPESLQLKIAVETTPNEQNTKQKELIQTVQEWASFRITTSPTKLNLFWIGDKPSESFLPQNSDRELITHWELLARSLDNQLTQHSIDQNTFLTSAWRDTAALAAILKSAIILTYQPSTKQEPPDICLVFESWGIPCRQIDFNDAIATLERETILHLITQAGLGKLLWSGLKLIVLHLIVPSTSNLDYHLKKVSESQISGTEESISIPNLWEGAQGFWYQLNN